MPSPINTVAQGYLRSTKPEILLPGGRVFYRPGIAEDGSATFDPVPTTQGPGTLTATPGIGPFEINRVQYSCGTSNAAALAGRSAARIHEMLSALRIPADAEPLTAEYRAVLIKAMLVHGASWTEIDALLQVAFPEVGDWRSRDNLKQRFLGYGGVDVDRCLSSTEQRATMVAWGQISDEEGQRYQIPLPPSLAASVEFRRLTVTLAWLSPTNHQHKRYRRAHLWFDVPEGQIGTEREGLEAKASQRGTVEHRTFGGAQARDYLDGATLDVRVNCKADAGLLTEPVPYGLAVTLEVGADVNIDIYQEINVRIRPVVQVEAVP